MVWSPKSPDFGFLAKNQSLETLDSDSTKKLITYFYNRSVPPPSLPHFGGGISSPPVLGGARGGRGEPLPKNIILAASTSLPLHRSEHDSPSLLATR